MENEKNSPQPDKYISRQGYETTLEAKVDSPQHPETENSDNDKDNNNNNNNNNTEDQPTSLDPPEMSIPQLLEEINNFLHNLSAEEQNKPNPPEVPNCVELFSDKIDSMITNYQCSNSDTKFGNNPDEDSSFFESLNHLSNLSDKFGDFSYNPDIVSALNRTSSVLQRAMSFLEEEFRNLL